MKKLAMLMALGFALTGCKDEGEYLNYWNPPRKAQSNEDYPINRLTRDAKIDILWVVDNSGSMDSIQQNIIKNSKLFMQDFLKNNYMDWKMGIMSTDKSEAPYLGFQAPFDAALSKDPTVDVVNVFQTAIGKLGTRGDASEYVFYNAFRGLTEFNLKSFMRPDAHLAVIMVTDEEEQSEDEFGPAYAPLSLLNSIRALKDQDKIIRFYGAFDFPDLQDCDSWGDDYAGSPFEKIIDETGGMHMSACMLDFGKGLSAIGKDIISIIKIPSLLLGQRPVLETLKIYYKDRELPSGPKDQGGFWYYSEYFNTVNFYDIDFADGDLKASIRIEFDVDDGIDRGNGDD